MKAGRLLPSPCSPAASPPTRSLPVSHSTAGRPMRDPPRPHVFVLGFGYEAGRAPQGCQGSLSGKQAELSGSAWEGAEIREWALGLGREGQRHCRPGLCQRWPRACFHGVKAWTASCHDPTISQTSTPTRREGRKGRQAPWAQRALSCPRAFAFADPAGAGGSARTYSTGLAGRAVEAAKKNTGSLTGLRTSP